MEDDWKVGDLVKVYLSGRPYGSGAQPTVSLALIIEKVPIWDDMYEEQTRKSNFYNIIIQNGPTVQRHEYSLYPVDMSDEEVIRKENEIPF